MKKYRIINEKDVLSLFKQHKHLTKKDITLALNTSLYQVLPIIDDLVDDDKIELVQVESPYNTPVMKYTLKNKDHEKN